MPFLAIFTDYISAGELVVAVGVFIWQIVTNIKQREYEKSGFRLTSALDAFKATHTLLNDNNNDRITWIAAARALERGNRMASGITEEVHRDVFEVHEDKYRQILSDILGFDNPEKKGNFFYGAPADISDINEAAKYSTAHESDRPQIRFIPETALKIFWILLSSQRITKTLYLVMKSSQMMSWKNTQTGFFGQVCLNTCFIKERTGL